MAVVGPTYPFKGGVAAHTTELAHRLDAAGHECDLVSWSRLYPQLAYPGEQVVPHAVPDVPPYARTTRPLSWARPDSWWRTGRALRRYDLVVVVHVVAVLAPAHLALLRSLGVGGRGVPVVVIAHNVLPHESHVGAERLVRALLGRADVVVVHSLEQADLARVHGARAVERVALAPHLPGGDPVERLPYQGPARLLALGVVRPYKGTDLLLEAMREVPDLTLTIAGELWGEAGERVRRLAADPELADRVEVREGYVPASRLAQLLAEHDVMVLPYRSATGSQNAQLGFAHGMPVVATRTGTFAQDVRDGVDGLLAIAGDRRSLVDALWQLLEPGRLDRLRSHVRPPDLTTPWRAYVAAVTAAGRRG